MRRAPPMVPGTPMRPSMPPRFCLAQKVTVRPRSAAASTWAKLPSMAMSGVGEASWRTTQGSSPSPTRRFEPPPRNLWGTASASRRFSRSGMASCFVMRSRSLVPPMPREVSAAREVPCFSWTPSSGNAATILGSSMRMVRWLVRGMLRPEEDHQFVAGAADVSGADGHDGVAGAGFAQQKFDAGLHRAEIVDVLVAGFADGVGERFTGDAGDGRFARGVDIQQHQNVGLIESAAEVVPEMLGARKAVGLEEDQQTIELAAAGGFEGSANFDRVMAVIVDHGDVVDDSFDVETAAHAGEFRESFAD